MTRRDHVDIASNGKSGIDSATIETVDPIKYAEVYASGDGRMRFVSDPFGGWIEAEGDALVEVRA